LKLEQIQQDTQQQNKLKIIILVNLYQAILLVKMVILIDEVELKQSQYHLEQKFAILQQGLVTVQLIYEILL
jgi:hypothetical protein